MITFDLRVCLKALPLIWNNLAKYKNLRVMIGIFQLVCAYLKIVGGKWQVLDCLTCVVTCRSRGLSPRGVYREALGKSNALSQDSFIEFGETTITGARVKEDTQSLLVYLKIYNQIQFPFKDIMEELMSDEDFVAC